MADSPNLPIKTIFSAAFFHKPIATPSKAWSKLPEDITRISNLGLAYHTGQTRPGESMELLKIHIGQIKRLCVAEHFKESALLYWKTLCQVAFALPPPKNHGSSPWYKAIPSAGFTPDNLVIIKSFCVALAWTDPRKLFTAECWDKGRGLISSPMTAAWAGIYQVVGAPWAHCLEVNDTSWDIDHLSFLPTNEDVEMEDSQAPIQPTASVLELSTPTSPPKRRSVQISEQPTRNSGLGRGGGSHFQTHDTLSAGFLSRTVLRPLRNSTPAPLLYSTKHTTWITIRFNPISAAPDQNVLLNYLCDYLRSWAKLFFTHQPDGLLLGDPDSDFRKATLDRTSTLPNMYKKFSQAAYTSWHAYIGSCFVRPNAPIYVSLLVGHNKPTLISPAFEADLISHFMYMRVRENQECRGEVKVGWLLGWPALRNAFSADSASKAINQLPILKNAGITVELRIAAIQQNRGGGYTKTQQGEYDGVHAFLPNYQDENKMTRAKLILRQIGSSKYKGPWPLGVQFRFVPSMNDDQIPLTNRVIRAHKKLYSKHTRFHKSLECRLVKNIRDIDFDCGPIDGHQYSLRNLLMHISSSKDPFQRALISMEQHWNTGAVWFVYSTHDTSLANDALQIISNAKCLANYYLGESSLLCFSDDGLPLTTFDPKLGFIESVLTFNMELDGEPNFLSTFVDDYASDDSDYEMDPTYGAPSTPDAVERCDTPFSFMLQHDLSQIHRVYQQNQYNDNRTIATNLGDSDTVVTGTSTTPSSLSSLPTGAINSLAIAEWLRSNPASKLEIMEMLAASPPPAVAHAPPPPPTPPDVTPHSTINSPAKTDGKDDHE